MTVKNSFLTYIQQQSLKNVKSRGRQSWMHCDEITMALALNKNVLKEKRTDNATLELIGTFTRGQMVVDYRNQWANEANVDIVTDINMELFMQLLKEAVL